MAGEGQRGACLIKHSSTDALRAAVNACGSGWTVGGRAASIGKRVVHHALHTCSVSLKVQCAMQRLPAVSRRPTRIAVPCRHHGAPCHLHTYHIFARHDAS